MRILKMLKIRQSQNGWLFYLEDEENKIVRVDWSEEALIDFMFKTWGFKH